MLQRKSLTASCGKPALTKVMISTRKQGSFAKSDSLQIPRISSWVDAIKPDRKKNILFYLKSHLKKNSKTHQKKHSLLFYWKIYSIK